MTSSQRRRRDRGQSLVEFSLIFPLAMLLFMALFDFGRAVFAMSAVSNAAREGVRTAVVNQNWSDIRERASQQATSLGIDTSLVACDAENQPASASGVCVRFNGADGTIGNCATMAIGCQAEVTTKWTFSPVTPIIGGIIGSRVITSTSRQPVENPCTGSCPIP